VKVIRILPVLAALLFGTTAAAQEVVGAYVAYIGRDDLYNSNGDRITRLWKILRQDRANFHRYRIAQRGDEWDQFFGSIENREAHGDERIDRSSSSSESDKWQRDGFRTDLRSQVSREPNATLLTFIF